MGQRGLLTTRAGLLPPRIKKSFTETDTVAFPVPGLFSGPGLSPYQPSPWVVVKLRRLWRLDYWQTSLESWCSPSYEQDASLLYCFLQVRFGRTDLIVPIITCGGMRQQFSWRRQDSATPSNNPITDECQRNFQAVVDRYVRCEHNCIVDTVQRRSFSSENCSSETQGSDVSNTVFFYRETVSLCVSHVHPSSSGSKCVRVEY